MRKGRARRWNKDATDVTVKCTTDAHLDNAKEYDEAKDNCVQLEELWAGFVGQTYSDGLCAHENQFVGSLIGIIIITNTSVC